MSRESDEIGESKHLESILGSIDMTKDGYPGEAEWLKANPQWDKPLMTADELHKMGEELVDE